MSSPKKAYLVLYNAASAAAWAVLLVRVAATAGTEGFAAVAPAVDDFARITQSFASLEILHALIGLVPAKLDTTVMQVFSRLLLVWGVAWAFPELTASPFYTSMLLAWSTTEVIRYGYFALRQVGVEPAWLTWARYSGFLVLYPLGISSEVAMIVAAVRGPAWENYPWYAWSLIAILVGYVPGSYTLYTYMLHQRKKALRGGEGKSGGSKKKQ